MKDEISRRDFVRTTAVVGAALAIPRRMFASPEPQSPKIRLGLASDTFRNFSRAQLIAFMKQLNLNELNAKDVKDHLPEDPQAEGAALADYAAAGIKLHSAGAIYFPTGSAGMRAKFDYFKR